jgi:hypothetical protein
MHIRIMPHAPFTERQHVYLKDENQRTIIDVISHDGGTILACIEIDAGEVHAVQVPTITNA